MTAIAPADGAANARSMVWRATARDGLIDVGELDPFDVEAFLLEELLRFHHRALAQAQAAAPVTDLDFLRERGIGERQLATQKSPSNKRDRQQRFHGELLGSLWAVRRRARRVMEITIKPGRPSLKSARAGA